MNEKRNRETERQIDKRVEEYFISKNALLMLNVFELQFSNFLFLLIQFPFQDSVVHGQFNSNSYWWIEINFSNEFCLGWPYGPFLRDAPLPGFLYCLKYPDFGCLHCADRSLYDFISWELLQSRADGSLCFQIALAVLQCHTMISAQLQVERTNKHVRVFASLLSFSPSYAPRLVDYVQYLHVIGQTTLDVLGNTKILARTCPV